MSDDRVLVTGGCGFIGSTLVRRLIERGHRITILDALTYAGSIGNLGEVLEHPNLTVRIGDIEDRQCVRSIFSREAFSAVINLAAQTHVDRSIADAESFVRTNILGTEILLDETKKYWARLSLAERHRFRFLQVSTDEVFGSLGNEGHFTETSPYRPRSPYAASKAAADHLVAAWFHTYGLPTIITFSGNNYGPRQYPEKLIPLAIKRALSGEPIPIYGNGKNVRDWIHVEDHVAGLIAALKDGAPGSTYCLSARDELTNLQVIELTLAALSTIKPSPPGKEYRQLLSFVADRPGHDWRYAMDPSRAEQDLGFTPIHRFGQTILEVVQHYVEAIKR